MLSKFITGIIFVVAATEFLTSQFFIDTLVLLKSTFDEITTGMSGVMWPEGIIVVLLIVCLIIVAIISIFRD